MLFKTLFWVRLHLDWVEKPNVCVWPFFFFFFSRVCETYGYWSCIVQWIVAAKFDFSHSFQPINAYHVLFTDPQISLFSNFFIKNRSHSTIHTFKNYFTTVFFSFQFQFSVFSCIQTNPKRKFRNFGISTQAQKFEILCLKNHT